MKFDVTLPPDLAGKSIKLSYEELSPELIRTIIEQLEDSGSLDNTHDPRIPDLKRLWDELTRES